MSAIIDNALNHLELNMLEIHDIDMLEHHIKEFMETCLHDTFDNNNTIVHGEVRISVTRTTTAPDDTIKISVNNGTHITMYRYGRGCVFTLARNYWEGFRAALRLTYMDESYVDSIMYELITTLVANHFLYMV